MALGAIRPDIDVAAALEEAAGRALRRGAHDAALEAARLAVTCTPAGDSALARRRIAVGRLLWRTNDLPSASDALRAALAEVDDPESRAQTLLELADVEAARIGLAASWDLVVEANECAVQPETRAKAQMFMAWSGLDRDVSHVHAVEAVRLFREANAGAAVIAEAESYVAQNAFMCGRDRDLEPVRRYVASEEAAAAANASQALSLLVDLAIRDDDLETAWGALERLHVAAADEGRPDSMAEYLKLRCEGELAEGRLAAARESAETMLATALESGMDLYVFEGYRRLARVCALQGDDEATTRAEAGLRSAASNPDLARWLGYTRGTVAFVRGDYPSAIAELSRGRDFMAEIKYRYPFPTAEPCLLAEALLATGDSARAEAVLSEYAEQAERWDLRRGIAAAARCRALLLAERGDASGAVAAADDAVAILDTINRPLDRAVALLTKGQVHRRFKQKALAKDALTRAAEEFDRLGAKPYAERARRELTRVGLRPPAPTQLTETERKVAELAAQGLNRADIAAALFISTHTVAANLTRVYRKLGVASRAELIAKMRDK
jgi:DNA-binding CsgD family transcriptional regulator